MARQDADDVPPPREEESASSSNPSAVPPTPGPTPRPLPNVAGERGNYAEYLATRIPPIGPCTLLIIRGLPGSGKTTLANAIRERVLQATGTPKDITQNLVQIVEAADYHRGSYDPNKLQIYHEMAQTRVADLLRFRRSSIVILTNTSCYPRDVRDYLVSARKANYRVVVCGLFDSNGLTDAELHARSSSKCPQDVIAGMRARYQMYPREYMGILSAKMIDEILDKYPERPPPPRVQRAPPTHSSGFNRSARGQSSGTCGGV